MLCRTQRACLSELETFLLVLLPYSAQCMLHHIPAYLYVCSCSHAQVRAGATLLYDSDPAAEEAETELKASAMIDAVTREDPAPGSR